MTEEKKNKSYRRVIIIGALLFMGICLVLFMFLRSSGGLDDINPEIYNDNPELKKLVEHLQGKSRPESLSKYDIIKQISALDDPRVMDVLIAVTSQKESYSNRILRISKISFFSGRLDFKGFFQKMRYLGFDGNRDLRRWAAWGLIKYKKNPEAVKAVLSCLDDCGKSIAWVLGEMDAPSVIPHLIPYIENQAPGDYCFTNSVTHAIGKLGNDSTVPVLIEIIKNDKTNDRNPSQQALCALEMIGSSKATTFIIPLLNDPSIDIRRAAIFALGTSGGKEQVNDILPFLKNENLIYEAIWALGEIGDCSAVPHISPFLKNKDPDFRICAIKALGKTGDSKQVANLLPFLGSKGYQIRLEAMRAIAALDKNSTFDLIKPMLKDKAVRIRMRAIKALHSINKTEAFRLIVGMLNDDENDSSTTLCAFTPPMFKSGEPSSVREMAIATLLEYGAPRALPHLKKRLKVEDKEDIVIALKKAIAKLEKGLVE